MKRILSIVIVFLMICSVIPVQAFAAGEEISESGTSYDLWLGSTRVTDANLNDILGDGGKAKYDPSTSTLTLKDPDIQGFYGSCKIVSSGINLTIKGSYLMKLDPEKYSDTGLSVKSGTLTLDGNFAFYGFKYGIYADKDVTIKSGILEVQESTVNHFEDNNVAGFFGLRAGGVLRILDDVEYFSAYAASISWGASVAAYYFEISDKLIISDPENAHLDEYKLRMNDYNIFTGYTVYDKNGNLPEHVAIKNPDFKWTYGLKLGYTTVTAYNKNDIFGDGKAKFDPYKNILTLHDPVITSRGSEDKIYCEDMGSLTVVGSYHDTSKTAKYGINVLNGKLTLQGNFTFSGTEAAVRAAGNIELINTSLVAKGGKTGISTGRSLSVGSRMDHVEAYGDEKAISSYSLSVTQYLKLITPKNGSVKDGTVYDSEGSVAKSVLFGKTYTVSFDPGDGSGTMESMVVERGQYLKMPECTFTPPKGKTFDTWLIGVNACYDEGAYFLPREDITATALYKDAFMVSSVFLHGQPHAVEGQSSTSNPPQGSVDSSMYRLDSSLWRYYAPYMGRYRWLQFDGIFEKGTEYIAEYVLSPKKGYAFSDTVTVYFDDLTTAECMVSDGKLRVQRHVVAEEGSNTGYILGDADTDKSVTIADVTAIQQNLAHINIPKFDEKAADVDGDKNVTIADATVIQQHLAKLPIKYKVGELIS